LCFKNYDGFKFILNIFIWIAVSSPSQKAVLSSFNQDQDDQNENEEEMEFGTFCEMTLSGNSKHIKFLLFSILFSPFIAL